MNKRCSLVLFLLLIGCTNQETIEKSLYDFIPQNTFAVFQVNDFNIINTTINNQDFLSNLTDLKPRIKATIKAITPDNIKTPALYCFTATGKSGIAISLIHKVNENDSLPKQTSISFLYNGVNINKTNVDEKVFYQTQMESINYISDSQLILENSIRNRQNEKQGIQENNFYTLAANCDENAPMNLLLHHDIKDFTETIFPETPLFPNFGKSWTAYDFNTKKEPFTLDGVTFLNDSLPDLLSLTSSLGTKPLSVPKIVPQSFKSLLTLSVNSMETLETNFKNFSRHQNIPLTTIDFDSFSVVDEIGWITLNDSKAVILHLNNTESINETLSPSKNEKTYRDISYYSATLPKDMRLFLSAFGTPINPSWAMLLDDFLIYSEDEKMIKQLIGSFKDGKVLETASDYQALKESLADNSSFLWLGHSKNLKDHWKALNTNESSSKWDEINADQYPLVGIQAVSENNFVQFRITVQTDIPELTKNSTTNQYSIHLDAPLSTSPQWLKNHRNKTMDVAVQDENNVLYLFSNKGTLFWKKTLPGKIIGPIKQVDLYKNGRLQMAFRTENRLMILDRNGKIVPPFDIKIPNDFPVQPLSVFDYDHNRNYRFLLSHGKSLLMYDNRGKKVNGFKLNKLRFPLTQPPKHIRLNGKDFIIMQQDDGNVRFISRTGKDRIQLNEKINFSNNKMYSYLNTFSTTDSFGNLVQIDTKGNVSRSPKALEEDHYISMTSKTLVTLSNNTLTIKGIPVSLPYGTYTRPKIFYINNIIFVSTTDIDTQKVYLYYSNGIAVGGFPVFGTGPLDISNADDDSALELVVQSADNDMMIYQINL